MREGQERREERDTEEKEEREEDTARERRTEEGDGEEGGCGGGHDDDHDDDGDDDDADDDYDDADDNYDDDDDCDGNVDDSRGCGARGGGVGVFLCCACAGGSGNVRSSGLRDPTGSSAGACSGTEGFRWCDGLSTLVWFRVVTSRVCKWFAVGAALGVCVFVLHATRGSPKQGKP